MPALSGLPCRPLLLTYRSLLKRAAARQRNNFTRYTLPGGKSVWIRCAGKHNAAWRYRLMDIPVKLLHADVLTPVPNLGGKPAIATEAQRLRDLAKAGVYVPKLLAVQDDALMFSHMPGTNLLEQITREAKQHKLDAWTHGIWAIGQVHRKGQFLSQAFARNMVIDGARVGFIDFEDNPGSVLNTPQCQSRDWLCYLHSTLLVLQRQNLTGQALSLWQRCFTRQPQEVQQMVGNSVRLVHWMRRLHDRRWGRDVLQLSALAQFFDMLPPL
ncbi:hypothetical protein [Neisseria perflava]|uniref:hypothetical protein n=1 Tax=Neisseria perflava TaxID=33053 RepID=UPI0020A10B83|nr:hypothetical protein [Neisseria perflava]MCP1660707.1 tRNA A-37 threonylcarbamoyl transferase component Bud32 [Neisseria perflava]